ncbi:hypothetical protein [Halomonas sp. SL1]|uniref:hypothetical protein n=1 Tax=Halomonas sp. SL1 TaxID=2137478 RepID=UPI0011B94615|nr:hypothetical protein [Halomonas sp. SL1]
MLEKFIRPYIDFILGASYNLHQILEGLGITSSSFLVQTPEGKITNSYWSPLEATAPIFGGLLLFTAFLFFITLLAAYALGKRKGVAITIIVISTPGILSLLGIFPNIDYLPERFFINEPGELGSEKGLIPLLVLGMLLGWSTLTIIYDHLKLNENFRQCYEILLLPTALVGAVFFVADNDASNSISLLEKEVTNTQQASHYLLNQVRRYRRHCIQEETEEKLSCQWGSYIQKRLLDLSFYEENLISAFLPESTYEFYAPQSEEISMSEITRIREEISAYNQEVCPVENLENGTHRLSPTSANCETPPSRFCTSFPDPPNGLVERFIAANTLALASECILPTLSNQKEKILNLISSVEKDKKSKNQRWLYFVLTSILIGGHLANASARVSRIDNRNIHNQKRTAKMLTKTFNKPATLLKNSGEGVRKATREIKNRL